MTKLEQVEAAILTARLNKDNLIKNLFQTLKGEYETATKKGEAASDSLVEKIAKKMVKNAELVNTPDAVKEIEILKTLLPVELGEPEIELIVAKALLDNPEKVAEYKNGNKGVSGWFVGTVIKNNPGINPKLVNKYLLISLTV